MRNNLKYLRYSLLRFVTLGLYIAIMNGCISVPAILVLVVGSISLFLVYIMNDNMPESLDYLRQPAIWLAIFVPAYACVSISQGIELVVIVMTCLKIIAICLPIAALISYLLKRIFGA